MSEIAGETKALPVYRQRLTPLGWFGVIAALGSPVLLGFSLSAYAEGLGNRYYKPNFPAAEAVILSLLSLGGWIMILVGREYYAFSPLAPVAPDAADDDTKPRETALDYFSGP